MPLVSGLSLLLAFCPCLLSCFLVALRGADDVRGRRLERVGEVLLRLGEFFFKLLETLFQTGNLCTRFRTPYFSAFASVH